MARAVDRLVSLCLQPCAFQSLLLTHHTFLCTDPQNSQTATDACLLNMRRSGCCRLNFRALKAGAFVTFTLEALVSIGSRGAAHWPGDCCWIVQVL